MQYDSPGKKVWRYVSPILVYYGIAMVVSFISSFFITWQLMGSLSANADLESFTSELMMKSLEASVPVYLASGLLALPFLFRMMRRDLTFRKFVGDKKALKKGTLLYCALAGILCSLAGSILVTLSQAGEAFSGYEEASRTIFSQSIIMQVIAAGLVMPFVEEMIFRGLIYNRMKDYMSANMAMILSSLFFGIYHGNLIQGAYGFVMGLLMIFVYEKYQTLAAPVICHIGANLISVILQFLNVTLSSAIAAACIAGGCLLALYLILKLIQNQVHVGVIPNKRFIDIHGGTAQAAGPGFEKSDASGKEKQETLPQKHYTVEDYYPKPKEDDEIKKED